MIHAQRIPDRRQTVAPSLVLPLPKTNWTGSLEGRMYIRRQMTIGAAVVTEMPVFHKKIPSRAFQIMDAIGHSLFFLLVFQT